MTGTRFIHSLWYRQMMRREGLKLDVEIARCRRYSRQHIPVDCVLDDARWKRKSDAKKAQKKYKLQPQRSW
jgi:hypothetical protein